MHRTIFAVAAAGLALTGASQQSEPSAPPFRSEVGIYRLQVRLVDASGADLSGIAAQELELWVEGEPRRIVDLMEIDATTLEPANRIEELGATPEAPGDRLSVATLSHGNATLPAARRRYMIFIDLSGGRIATLIARAAAREFVEEIAQSGDLIGVTTYSIYGGLHYIVPFTSDRGLVREALGKAAADPSRPGRRGTQLATLQDLIAEESAAFGREGDASRTRLIEQLQRVETNISASGLSDALADMSDALADIQGRKQIVFFSTGFPDAAVGDTDVRLSLIAAAVAARRAEVVFHTFHPEVLGRYSDNDVSRMSSGFPLPSERVRGPLDDAPPRRSRGVPGNDRAALNYLSGETGGTSTFFKHTLRRGLEDMERQTRRYYTLAFAVHESDAEEIRIQIRARDPAVHVQWAPTRLLLKAPERDSVGQQFQVANALEFGSDLTGMNLTAAVLPQPMSGGFGRFATLIQIPHEQLVRLLQSGDDDHLSFELLGLAMTSSGTIADRFQGQIQFAEAAAQLASSDAPLRYQNLLVLASGEFIIKLLVRERELGLLTSRTFRVTVPAAVPRGFAVSVPLAVAADGGTSIVQGAALERLPEHRRDLPLDNPFVVNGRLLSPRAGPLALTDQPIDVFVTVQNFAPHPFTGRQRLSVQSWIEDDAAGRHPLGVAVMATEQTSRQPPIVRFLLGLAPPRAVPPGSYRLVIQITDHIGGSSTQSSVPVAVWNR